MKPTAPAIATTTATATSTATYLPHANSITMYSRLVRQDRHFFLGEPAYLPNNTKNVKSQKIIQTFSPIQ